MLVRLTCIIFALLPIYLVRFHIGSLPGTVLEVLILVTCAVWFKQKKKHIGWYIKQLKKKHSMLYVGIWFFLVGATISIFTSTSLRAAAGEWKAFYAEPILLCFVLIGIFKDTRTEDRRALMESIMHALIACGLITSLLAIYQHFTGFLVPDAFWKSGRVTAWYGFPNAVGLFLAPIVPLTLYMWLERGRQYLWKIEPSKIENVSSLLSHSYLIVVYPIIIVLLILAILFAKSTGAIVGLTAGIGVLLLLHKKTRWPAVAVGIIGLITLLLLPATNPIRTELLAQDRSGHIRMAIWSETLHMLKDRPIFGAGMASFDERITPYHGQVNGEDIEIFHHPHNLFLTIYVNTGLVGLIGFILILIWFYKKSMPLAKHDSSFFDLPIYLTASMTVILVSGLVDSPYIKNDVSVLFWLLPALMVVLIDSQKPSENTTYQNH